MKNEELASIEKVLITANFIFKLLIVYPLTFSLIIIGYLVSIHTKN